MDAIPLQPSAQQSFDKTYNPGLERRVKSGYKSQGTRFKKSGIDPQMLINVKIIQSQRTAKDLKAGNTTSMNSLNRTTLNKKSGENTTA